jgi:hypothetical protein
MATYHVFKKDWEGETCFILCGGPSVGLLDIDKLQGHKLIVINSSFYRAPWADYLMFSDTRWWDANVKKIERFKGKIICASSLARHPRLLRMKRKSPPGLSPDPGYVVIKYTTLASAINIAVHLGVKKVVLVGADGKNGGADGKQTHHHTDYPHQWKQMPGTFDKQRRDLGPVAKDLVKLGVECVNASPDSAWADLWPIVDFEEMIRQDTKLETVAA